MVGNSLLLIEALSSWKFCGASQHNVSTRQH